MTYPKTSVLALCLATGLGGAGLALAQDAPGAAELKVALTQYDGSEVLATVEGHEITLGDAALTYASLPGEVSQVPADQILSGLTEQLINEMALYDKAMEDGLDEDPVVQRRIEALARATLAEEWLSRALEERITTEQLRETYDLLKNEVSARHILVKTEDEAKAVVAALEDGADFAELAKEKSTGPSGADGGDLGWFSHDKMVKPFADAAFAMEAGAVSEPVKTQFGWHVIKVEDRRARELPPFEDLEGQLRAQASQSVAETLVQEVRDAAEVTRAEETPPAFLVRQSEMYGEN